MKKIYLAIPYTGMRRKSYKMANAATANIMKGHPDINVFSPITHSHPMTKFKMPQTWEFWGPIDEQFIDWADEVWIFLGKIKSTPVSILDFTISSLYEKVRNSTGVQAEMRYAILDDKPIQIVVLHEGRYFVFNLRERDYEKFLNPEYDPE